MLKIGHANLLNGGSLRTRTVSLKGQWTLSKLSFICRVEGQIHPLNRGRDFCFFYLDSVEF